MKLTIKNLRDTSLEKGFGDSGKLVVRMDNVNHFLVTFYSSKDNSAKTTEHKHLQQIISLYGLDGYELPAPPKNDKKSNTKDSAGVDDMITLQMICDQLGLEPVKARRILRGSNIEKPGAKWEWPTMPEDVFKLLKGEEA